MLFTLASCCEMPAPITPDDIHPWMVATLVCGMVLLGEAGTLRWRLRGSASKPWLRYRVVIPALLGALALAAAALDWFSSHALAASMPDAWQLAYAQRTPGDWFEQLDSALTTAGFLTLLAIGATVVSLAVGAVVVLADD